MNSNKLDHTLNFAELKQTYFEAIDKKRVCKNQSNQSHVMDLVRSWDRHDHFYGPSSAQMREWLHKGYQQPGLVLDPPIEPVRKRRRVIYGEEGELQIDLMYSGHDYPFLDWTKRETMPGMHCKIHANFQAGTRVDVIAEYYRFVLRSLIALEGSGVDLEIWLTSYSVDLFSRSNKALESNVQVKKEGEQTDYLGWSPMLSPGGYRHLKFLHYILASDAHGLVANSSLGRGVNQSQPWEIAYDPEERILSFKCPYHPHDFPEKEMEMQLRTVLSEARRRVA